jgi:hypothetical protein
LIARGGKYARLCEQSLLEAPRDALEQSAELNEIESVDSPDEQMPATPQP